MTIIQMKFPLKDILALRFILRQPSIIWQEFNITDIEIVKKHKPEANKVNL